MTPKYGQRMSTLYRFSGWVESPVCRVRRSCIPIIRGCEKPKLHPAGPGWFSSLGIGFTRLCHAIQLCPRWCFPFQTLEAVQLQRMVGSTNTHRSMELRLRMWLPNRTPMTAGCVPYRLPTAGHCNTNTTVNLESVSTYQPIYTL